MTARQRSLRRENTLRVTGYSGIVIMTSIGVFGDFCLDAVAILIMYTLAGFIDNSCQLELASVLMLESVF